MIALDLSRLLSRAGRGTPTGIDRVARVFSNRRQHVRRVKSRRCRLWGYPSPRQQPEPRPPHRRRHRRFRLSVRWRVEKANDSHVRQIADRHVLDHAAAQSSSRPSRVACPEGWASTTTILSVRRLSLYPLTPFPRQGGSFNPPRELPSPGLGIIHRATWDNRC